MKPRSKILVKYGLIASFLVLAFVGFMGFAHTKAGRPVLAWMGKMMGKAEFCPLGYDRPATVADRQARRQNLAEHFKSRPHFGSNEFLGFRFNETLKSDAQKSILSKNGSCQELKSGHDLECSGQIGASTKTTLWLEFDGSNHLVSLRSVEEYGSADAAMSAFKASKDRIIDPSSSIVDEKVQTSGQLQAGLLRQASVQSEYGNLKASVRVTNLGDRFVVSQDIASF